MRNTIPRKYAVRFKHPNFYHTVYVLALTRQKAKYIAAKEAVNHYRYPFISVGEALKHVQDCCLCYT